MKTTAFLGVLWAAVLAAIAAVADEGLVADYRFDEGQGTVLHDRSGNGNDGAIHGASWVRSGDNLALRFDGVDDYVDCGAGPSLNLSKAATIEAWIHPDGVAAGGEAVVLGKFFSSYLLVQYGENYWFYVSGGGNNAQTPVRPRRWQHVVATFDGKSLLLYVDGAAAGVTTSKAASIEPGGALWMGASPIESQYTRGAHFKGMLTEARIYDRALSAEEVARHYRTTRLTNEPAIHSCLYPVSGTLAVEMDFRGLGQLPAGAVAVVEFCRPDEPNPLHVRRVALSPSSDRADATLALGQLAAGQYELRATVTKSDGTPIGKTAAVSVQWPERPRWENAPDAKVLNNLVTELLDASPRKAPESFSFVNPRDGWIWIATTAAAGQTGPASVLLDGQPLSAHTSPGTLESMRWVAKGEHRLEVAAPGIERLVVRAIPELVYAAFGADPHVREYGKYDWDFLAKHVLPNINVMDGRIGKEQEPLVAEWKRQGKRWLVECGVPGAGDKKGVTADEAEKYWATSPGMTSPLLDGVLVDEFWAGMEPEKYAAWTEAARRLRAAERFQGKLFYPYCAPMYGAKASREFLRAIADAGWRFAFERYLPEQRSEKEARTYLDVALRQTIADWRDAQPGAERQMIVCLGTFSQPPESLDVNPGVNLKVYLDMQMNLLANDPSCFGLYGVMTYLSSYTDEETVRWMGRLFRHYCIEGKAEPLARDPLMLKHLENPDFENGTGGWTVAPAEPGSVAVKSKDGWSWLQGRYPKTSEGDTVLWMKRSSRGPNAVTQTIKDLQPGRLYALRMYSADYRDMSVQQKLAVSIALDGVDVIAEKSFQHVFANCYSHHHGPFDAEHKAWMNYHWIVFRAKAAEAALGISDWSGPADPGGPAGQESMMNFVEVQPYEP